MAPFTEKDTQRITEWRGRDALDNDGDKIGEIQEIYLDRSTGAPQWALVSAGLLGTRGYFIPLEQSREEPDGVRFPYEKGHVKDAPSVDADEELPPEEEQRLYAHYGLEWGEFDYEQQYAEPPPPPPPADREPVGHDTSGPSTDHAMTRSEEELAVGKTTREIGRARLRKYVVTEHVQTTVPVQREEVRIEREPVTDANVGDATDGPAISEEEHEVVLHEERQWSRSASCPRSASASTKTPSSRSSRSPRKSARSKSRWRATARATRAPGVSGD